MKSEDIISTNDFERELKKLLKKYPSLRGDLKTLFLSLLENPTQGSSLGKDSFKIRLKIESKNAGKSGGARVLTCVKIVKSKIFVFGIYDKSEISTLTDKEIQRRLSELEDF